MKLTILRNLGREWPKDKDGKAYQEGKEYSVTKEIGERMIQAGVAKHPQDPDPVQGDNVPDEFASNPHTPAGVTHKENAPAGSAVTDDKNKAKK